MCVRYESFTNFLCYSTGVLPEDGSLWMPPSEDTLRRTLVPISIENLPRAKNPFGNPSSSAPTERLRSGRKQKKRLRCGSQRPVGPYVTRPQTCTRCGKTGHNKRNRGGCNNPRGEWTYIERVRRNKELRHRHPYHEAVEVIDEETSSIYAPTEMDVDEDTDFGSDTECGDELMNTGEDQHAEVMA
jgi:hypothetical protein